jgi:hypothetical protein
MMHKKIQDLAIEHGLYCDGVPDSWDEAAIEAFGKAIAVELMHECRNVAIRADEARQTHEQSEFGDAFNQGQQVGALACAGVILRFIEEEE